MAATLASIGSGAALGASGGGVGAPNPPTLTDVTCQNRCAGLREAAPGSRVQLTGRDLEYVTQVEFNESGGGRVSSDAQNVSATALEAIVPNRAATGRPRVVDSMGNVAESPAELVIAEESTLAAESGAGVGDVSARPSKGFFMGKKRAAASFVPFGRSSQDVRVDVVHEGSGSVVRSLVVKDASPGTPARVRWNGKTEDRDVAPNGEYHFDVRPLAGGNGDRAGFEQYDHIFPLKGRHSYGDGLGAGRNHQGVDVFAKCGKRIVAARGGKVQHKAYHSRAGNYVVIDGKRTNVDYAYMHLAQPSKLSEGDKVKTGALVGRNGETGNASGCHLHFEMWKGGWYEGGSVKDPMPLLKRWDDWS